MNGEDVARWGGKLHGQMRGGDDSAKGVEVVVREGYERHAAFVMGMGNVVDWLDMAEGFLSGRRARASSSETATSRLDITDLNN